MRLQLDLFAFDVKHAYMLHGTLGLDDGGCHSGSRLVYSDIVLHCERRQRLVFVTPHKQINPFGQLIGMDALLIVCAWPFALEPVLVDEQDVERAFRWASEGNFLSLE